MNTQNNWDKDKFWIFASGPDFEDFQLDRDIIDILITLNKLSCIKTVSSCSGHISTNIIGNEDTVIKTPHLIMEVDKNDTRWEKIVNGTNSFLWLTAICKKYCWVIEEQEWNMLGISISFDDISLSWYRIFNWNYYLNSEGNKEALEKVEQKLRNFWEDIWKIWWLLKEEEKRDILVHKDVRTAGRGIRDRSIQILDWVL